MVWSGVMSRPMTFFRDSSASTNDGAPKYEAVLVEFDDGEQDALSANQIYRGRATLEDVERVLGCRVEDLPGYVEEPVEGWNS